MYKLLHFADGPLSEKTFEVDPESWPPPDRLSLFLIDAKDGVTIPVGEGDYQKVTEDSHGASYDWRI